MNLLPKDVRFEHGGAKLASCPGRHLTSLRPWSHRFSKYNVEIIFWYIFLLFRVLVKNCSFIQTPTNPEAPQPTFADVTTPSSPTGASEDLPVSPKSPTHPNFYKPPTDVASGDSQPSTSAAQEISRPPAENKVPDTATSGGAVVNAASPISLVLRLRYGLFFLNGWDFATTFM